jgi:hypothetical protein
MSITKAPLAGTLPSKPNATTTVSMRTTSVRAEFKRSLVKFAAINILI